MEIVDFWWNITEKPLNRMKGNWRIPHIKYNPPDPQFCLRFHLYTISHGSKMINKKFQINDKQFIKFKFHNLLSVTSWVIYILSCSGCKSLLWLVYPHCKCCPPIRHLVVVFVVQFTVAVCSAYLPVILIVFMPQHIRIVKLEIQICRREAIKCFL